MPYIALIVALIAAALAFKLFVQRITVFEFERALKYRRGRYVGTLLPGVYWVIPQITTIRKVDVRPAFVSISGQEVLSSDGVTLKASLAAKYQIIDPNVAVNKVENYQGALYLELQLGLRQIVGSAPITELLEKRQEFGARLTEQTLSKAEELGLKLLSVDIKDIMFPGELKKIFTQVVKARQEGLAALEKARGETAALRNLTNAAQLVERNPALMQLRLLQKLGESSGNTLVLGMPSQTTTLPLKSGEVNEPKTIEPKESEDH